MAEYEQKSVLFFGQLLHQSADTGTLTIGLDERGISRDSEVSKLLGSVYRKEAGFFIFLPTHSYSVPPVPFKVLEEIANSTPPTPKRSWSQLLRANIWYLYTNSPILQEIYATEEEFYAYKMAEIVGGVKLEAKLNQL